MSNCEIVSNVACGKEFQYCRTHKVEPHQCPGAKQEVVFQTPFMTLEPRKGYTGVDLAVAATPKREFKVGDKVRCISTIKDLKYWQFDWISANGLKVGGIYTVSRVNNANIDPALEVEEGVGYGVPQSCFEVVG